MIKKMHLESFKISNFKKFKQLELDDIGLVNLIGGDNNVGKTSLLESLLFDKDVNTMLKYYHRTLCIRGLHIHLPRENNNQGVANVESYLDEIINWNSDIKELKIKFSNTNKKLETLKLTPISYQDIPEKEKNKFYQLAGNLPSLFSHWIKLESSNTEDQYTFLYYEELAGIHPYVPLIKIADLYTDKLALHYSKIVRNYEDKLMLIKTMSNLIDDIKDIELLTPFNEKNQIYIRTGKYPDGVHLTQFGDGAVKLFRIIIELFSNRGKRLMIDEFGSGIHFRRLKQFWKTIITTAKSLETQLFITTHSLETIEALIEAAEDTNFTEYQKEIRYYELIEDENLGTNAYKYAFEELAHSNKMGINIRGRK